METGIADHVLDAGSNYWSIVLMKRRFIAARIVANAVIVFLLFAGGNSKLYRPSTRIGARTFYVGRLLTVPFITSCFLTFCVWIWR